MPRALVILAEGFEEIEAATPIDVLRRAGVEVVVAGLSALTVRGARGLALQADALLADCDPPQAGSEPYDLVLLPGGMPGASNLAASPAVTAVLARAQAAGARIAAICAAPAVVLAPLGYLEGKRATCYPGFEQRFPAGATHSEERVCVDGLLTTSRGPGTALEFALRLVAQLCSPERADELQRGMLA